MDAAPARQTAAEEESVKRATSPLIHPAGKDSEDCSNFTIEKRLYGERINILTVRPVPINPLLRPFSLTQALKESHEAGHSRLVRH
jgi:hypothetical protein